MARILVVEDEKPLALAIRRGLDEEGYSVDVAYDGEEGLWAAGGNEYDAIILDRMLPRLDGMGVCARLREKGSEVPILMLTVLDEVEDVVAGLDAGADDYLTKPFVFEELLARIRALLRIRSRTRVATLRIADLVVETGARRVTCAGQPIDLTAKEYQILEYLLLHQGEVVSKTRLAETAWARAEHPDSNVIEVYIANLRRKIERGRRQKLIHTIRGAGYALREGAP